MSKPYYCFVTVKLVSSISAIIHAITHPVLGDTHLVLTKECVWWTDNRSARKLTIINKIKFIRTQGRFKNVTIHLQIQYS